jgi:quercetin dioxygenase-like cupin family protein
VTTSNDELLALEVLGLLDDEAQIAQIAALETEGPGLDAARAELEEAASLLALTVEPVQPKPDQRARLLAELDGAQRFAPFIDRVAALFDLGADTISSILDRFGSSDGWTVLYPGASFHDLVGGPALEGATAGLVRIGPGLAFPRHKHLGEERVMVLQGAFEDDSGRRVGPGQLEIMPDGSEHAFTVVSTQELLYVVVVRSVEFEDGTRAP